MARTSRCRSTFASVALVLACLWCLRAAAGPFVPAPVGGLRAPAQTAVATSVVGAIAASAPFPATAADEYIAYNYSGEWTSGALVAYFGLTLGATFLIFLSYLILTKLKII